MLAVLKGANLALAFFLELAVLFSAGLWGFTLKSGTGVKILAGLGAPAALIVLWALFGAPGASHALHGGTRLAFEILWFGLGALTLWAAGRAAPALILALLWILNTVLIRVWHQHS